MELHRYSFRVSYLILDPKLTNLAAMVCQRGTIHIVVRI